MIPGARRHKILWIAAFRWALRFAAMSVLFVSGAFAGPVTYSGFTITDGQLGPWHFHNARIFLTFASDTSNVQTVTIPNPSGAVDIVYNQTGTARITIVDDNKTVHASFEPNQIFVSFDLTNGGVGFGSCVPTCLVPLPTSPNLQPAYPLGVAGGIVDGPVNLAFSPSPEEVALSADLMHDVGFSGRGWVCVTFPDSTCPAPTAPLKTNKGDLFLFQPYQGEPLASSKVLNAGLFFVDATDPDSGFPPSLFMPSSRDSADRITYNAFLTSDVSIGGRLLKNAKIHLFFSSHRSEVEPLSGSGPHAFVNEDGTARVVITKGASTIRVKFDPHQLYVFFDPSTASVGFGSFGSAGGRAYPITFTNNTLNTPQLAGAVSDIINNPANAANYTPETATLVTNLKNETVLADFASSCPAPAFDPATSNCSNLTTPTKLTTNKGDFFLFEPYTQTQNSSTFSNNWGVFWSAFGSEDESEDDE
jgi:hypothetical protein